MKIIVVIVDDSVACAKEIGNVLKEYYKDYEDVRINVCTRYDGFMPDFRYIVLMIEKSTLVLLDAGEYLNDRILEKCAGKKVILISSGSISKPISPKIRYDMIWQEKAKLLLPQNTKEYILAVNSLTGKVQQLLLPYLKK